MAVGRLSRAHRVNATALRWSGIYIARSFQIFFLSIHRLASNRDWEVLVGQSIACRGSWTTNTRSYTPTSNTIAGSRN
jgi:hypothetical protein